MPGPRLMRYSMHSLHTTDANGMSSERLRAALHARGWPMHRLESMTDAQLRIAVQMRLQHCGFTRRDVDLMTPIQMRTALAGVCPGLWTTAELAAMEENELRQQLARRLRPGVRYFDKSDVDNMDDDQLRAALRTYWPGSISNEDLARMSRHALQKTLWNRRALAFLGSTVEWV